MRPRTDTQTDRHTDARDHNTLSVFGVGRRPRPRAAAAVPSRPRRLPEVSPPPPTVRRRPIRSLGDVAAATKRSTTPRLTLCGPPLGILDRFPHPSNYFRLTNSTSGRGRAPQTERRSTPAHKVQRFRHSAVVFAHLPGISHFPTPKWRLKLLAVPVLT